MAVRLVAAAAALMLSGCTTTGALDPLAAAGFTRAAYCALTPEARVEVQRRLGFGVPLMACPDDATRRPYRRSAR